MFHSLSKIFTRIFLVLFFLIGPCVLPLTASSAGYIPLAPIPGLTDGEGAGGSDKSLSIYFQNLYKFGVGVATALALVMVVYGGVEYVSTDAIGGKEEGKERIQNAILGMMLALGSFVILKTIDQSFTKSDIAMERVEVTVDTVIPGDSPGSTPSGKAEDPAGSGGHEFVADGEEFSPNLTAYSPKSGGDKMEGGYESSKAGLDGKAIVRTLDDVINGKSTYVTLAGDPSEYGQTYMIPSITYKDASGATKTLTNVMGYVHDTGSAFTGAGKSHFDIAVGRDYTTTEAGRATLNSQPFSGGKTPIVHSSKSN